MTREAVSIRDELSYKKIQFVLFSNLFKTVFKRARPTPRKTQKKLTDPILLVQSHFSTKSIRNCNEYTDSFIVRKFNLFCSRNVFIKNVNSLSRVSLVLAPACASLIVSGAVLEVYWPYLKCYFWLLRL